MKMTNSMLKVFTFGLVPALLLLLRFIGDSSSQDRITPVTKSEITLVSAWYPDRHLVKADNYSTFYTDRHNNSRYFKAVEAFLSQVTTPIVLFCPPYVASELTGRRPASLPIQFITEYESVWDFKAIEPLHMFLSTDKRVTDGALVANTPHKYAVWNAKPAMLDEVARRNPFQSTYFFWHDIGSMRAREETV